MCLADVDGDGRPDVFLARTEGPSALYRNLGDWRFEDVTVSAGVAAPGRYATGCAFADVDGDGDQDLLLVSLGGPNALFVNDGKGHFMEQTAGLTDRAGSMTIAVTDVDGDGDLDLYIVNNKAYTTLDRMSPQERAFSNVTRQLGPRHYEVREQYRRDYWATQPRTVEIWCEKDALAGVMTPICDEYGATFVPLHGFGSLTIAYEPARELRRAGKPANIYYFGDHDGSGWAISRAIEEELRAHDAPMAFTRVALSPPPGRCSISRS